MGEPGEHISAWEAAGLIDGATADRLRTAAAQGAAAPAGVGGGSLIEPAPERATSVAATFGPAVSIGEMFGYLGAAFLLAAWTAFVVRVAGPNDSESIGAAGSAAVAVVLGGLGLRLRTGDARRARAAGVAFAVAVGAIGLGVTSLASLAGLDWPVAGVIASGAAFGVAVAFRIVHPAVLTQLSAIAWLTFLAGAILAWLQSIVAPTQSGVDPHAGDPSPMVLLVASAAWWLAWAVGFGLIALRESRHEADDPPASRRAALSRLWAGLVAVVGLASAVTRTTTDAQGVSSRVLEPWMAALAMFILCAVLLERAFRREASSFVYAAGAGVIFALTDLNASYLASTPELGLLVEGLILIGVGLVADRLRRRIGRHAGSGPSQPTSDTPSVTPVAS